MSKYKLYADDCSCRCLSLPWMNTVTELHPELTFVVRNTCKGGTWRLFLPAGSVKTCIHERGIRLADDVQRKLEGNKGRSTWGEAMAPARHEKLKLTVIFYLVRSVMFSQWGSSFISTGLSTDCTRLLVCFF